MKKIYFFIIPILFFSLNVFSQQPWKNIDKGLDLGIFQAPVKSLYGDSKIYVLKINPKDYNFELLLATEHNKKLFTPQEFCKTYSLLGCINAGMYDGKDADHPENDGFINRGYTQNFTHINNPIWSNDKSVIAFNPKDSTVPLFQIIDTQCKNINDLKNKYNTLVQGIRMVDCKQTNRWFRDNKLWGMSVMAADKDGNMLWIHTYSPYTVYGFTDMLLKMPLKIYNIIYLDGGIPSIFYVAANGTNVYRRGTYPDSFADKDFEKYKIIVPNVIGFKKKE